MGEIAKIDKDLASICKGEDKKNDAMMLMSPESNWDQFLTPAPFAIALLGELILISSDTDFSLEEKPPRDGFKHLRYPNSFRASLVQVSNEGWSAFNEAHTSMDQIFLHSGNVDGHVKNAVRFLLQGSPNEVEKMLPMSLSKIQNIADESLNLAKAIEERFVGVMELTGELLEACTNTKGVYDEKSRETEIAIKVAKTQREHREKEVKESERRLQNMEKEVKDAQSDFKDAIDKIPTGGSLLKLAAGEALVDGIRGITSLPGLLKQKVKKSIGDVFKDDDSGERDEAYYDRELSIQRVYAQVSVITENVESILEIVAGEFDDHGNECPDLTSVLNGNLDFLKTSLENCRSNIKGEVKSGKPGARALKICNEGIMICTDLKAAVKSIQSENPQNQTKRVTRARKLQQEAQTLNVEASKAQGKNPLDNKSPHLSKMPTESSSPSAVNAATENARFKTELAKETLKDAKRRQEKSSDELRESNEKLIQVLTEMAQLDLKHIDFNKIRDTLVKGIKALAMVREQWGKLVRFFQMLSNLIKCCLHTSLQDFVDQAKMGRELKMGDSSTPLSNIFRDVIFEQASKASQIAYVVRAISGTYVQISNEHLMDKITCLGRLVALDPKKDEHEILIRRRELHSGCSKAQKSIQSIVLKQKAEFNQNIEERMRKIKEIEAKLPPIEPKREEEIKKSVSDGMTNFSNDEMEDLI